MKYLKNWDKKNWLSSPEYTASIISFLEKRIKFNKAIKILDIGCGRGKIISTFSKKYQMSTVPLGLDIIDNNDTKKNIRFTKINALEYLINCKKSFDLILFKQSIHFFKYTEIKKILRLSKKNLNPKGKIIILALHPKQNHWPLFKIFKSRLIKSLTKDRIILNLIKLNFKRYKINYFKFEVKITKNLYLKMIKNRFTSCLLDLSSEELINGIKEIRENNKKKLIFFDKLICISYEKK